MGKMMMKWQTNTSHTHGTHRMHRGCCVASEAGQGRQSPLRLSLCAAGVFLGYSKGQQALAEGRARASWNEELFHLCPALKKDNGRLV